MTYFEDGLITARIPTEISIDEEDLTINNSSTISHLSQYEAAYISNFSRLEELIVKGFSDLGKRLEKVIENVATVDASQSNKLCADHKLHEADIMFEDAGLYDADKRGELLNTIAEWRRELGSDEFLKFCGVGPELYTADNMFEDACLLEELNAIAPTSEGTNNTDTESDSEVHTQVDGPIDFGDYDEWL